MSAGGSGGSGGTSNSMLTPPRLIAPLSTALTTSRTPTLHWSLASGTDGAQVQICKDRACSMVLQTFTATGSSGKPMTMLNAGVYYWRLAGTSGGSVGSTYSNPWEFWVGQGSASVDTSWGTTLDVNGDGFADVLVGAEGSNTAYLYQGSSSGAPMTPNTTLTGPSGSMRYGISAKSAGDLNGDGFADVIVGDDMSNKVYIYLGSAMGLSTTPTILTGPAMNQFGFAVSSAGDVNGDGYADVLIGTYTTNTAYVYLGSASGLSATPTLLTGAMGSISFGSSVASAGDVNGDGFADVIVGGPTGASVFLGSSGGVSTTAMPLTVPTGSIQFGSSVSSAGDVNGDGYADILVGTFGSNTAYLFLGSSSGASSSGTTLSGAGNTFGVNVSSAGDVDGDGFGDVLVGSASNEANVYFGSSSGLASATSPLVLREMGGAFGRNLSGAGDINGDGYADIVVGAYGTNTAYVYLGTMSGGLPSMPSSTLRGPMGSQMFGVSVASLEKSAPGTLLLSPRELLLGARMNLATL